MILKDILLKSVQLYGSFPALTMRMGYRTITLTYDQVAQLSKKIALFLNEKGAGKGDCVLLCAPNSPYWACMYWACALQGCVVVPLAMQSTQETIDKIAEQTGARYFFKSHYTRFLVPQAQEFIIERIAEIVADYDSSTFTPVDASQHDLAEIMYTSGTTGDPKGVMLTNENIVSNVMALNKEISLLGVKERLLSILPLSHMFEQTIGFLLPFSEGAHIIYAHSHGAIRELLKQYRITKIMAVPEFLKLLANRISSQMGERHLNSFFTIQHWIAQKAQFKKIQRLIFWPIHHGLGGSLDTIASGGAALDPDLEMWWDEMGLYILQGYGLTETAPVVTLNTFKNSRIGSVGKPLEGVQVRIDNNGEILIKGPNVFKGYFKNDEKTKESFTEDGWFKTGDMGLFDDDGFLFLKGRKKYMIKGAGAQNIFPEDIELVLNNDPAVVDSCVIGLERTSGLEIHAVLLLKDQQNQGESLINKANEQLAVYQHITGWSVWPESDFPRSATRKIKKEAVIAWVKDKNHSIGHSNGIAVGPLVQILSEITGVAKDAIHTTTLLVRDLKFDSLMRVELVTRVEELHGIIIDERLITAQTTVAGLEQIIATSQPIIKIPRVKSWPRKGWARYIRVVGQALIMLIPRIFFTIKIEGAEHLNGLKQPVIFMPNHVSLIDGLIIMMALPREMRKKISFAAAYDAVYQDYWYATWFVELVFNAFPFPRKEHEHIATGLLNMGTMLDDGYSVMIFPEGRVSTDGIFQSLKRGAGLVVVEMGCPVIPIILKGVEQLVPYDCLIPRKRGNITIKIGSPLKFDHSLTYDQASAQVEEQFRKML